VGHNVPRQIANGQSGGTNGEGITGLVANGAVTKDGNTKPKDEGAHSGETNYNGANGGGITSGDKWWTDERWADERWAGENGE
jgi:hypothetical protein